MKGSDFIFDNVDQAYFSCQKTISKRSGSYTVSLN